MGFFKGLADGFKTGRQMKADEEEKDRLAEYRKAETDYRTARDETADSRYISELEDARRIRAEDQAYQAARNVITDKQHEEQAAWTRQYQGGQLALQEETLNVTSSQWDRTFEHRKERDSVGDDQWEAQQEDIREAAVESKRRFEKQFNFTSTEAEKAAERWKTKFGFEEGRALKADEWQEAMQEYQVTRNAVNDEQWSKQFTYNQEQASIAHDQFRQRMNFDKGRALTQEEQWQAEKAWREERAAVTDQQVADQLKVTNTTALLELMPTNLASALGGSGGDTNKGSVPSVGAIEAGATEFTVAYEELSDEVKSSPFFKAASSDVAAQATLMAFVKAQAKQNNTITLDQLPKYFKYLGAVEGKGEAAVTEFMNSVLSGDVDVSNTDTFIKGLKALKGYKPTQQLFMQTGAPQDITDATQQVKVWETAVEVDAYRAVQGLKGDQKSEVQSALAMLERKENRTKGLDILARYGFGANAVKEYNMGDNPVVSSYYNSNAPTTTSPTTVAPTTVAPTVNTDVAPTVNTDVAPTVNTDVAPTVNTDVAAGDVTMFNSWAEVEAARNEGYSGLASVGGVSYMIEPPTEAAETAPTVEQNVDTSTPPSEEAFLGTGFQLEEENNDTAIDAMFAETVEGPLVVPADAEQWPNNRPTINEFPDVDMAKEVKSLEASTTVEDAMAVLMGMNIEMPTNREELGFFKEDLKSVIYESGANVSDEILKGIIAVAAENSTKGETMQDQTSPPPAEAKPEPIVKRRKPKVKEMTSSDKARLKRAQEAGELRGEDSSLLDMLVEKYGEDVVQKEMGL